MDALDGNAIGGLLIDVFGTEMTTARSTCATCGASRPVAELVVYRQAPGTVVRCRTCGSVLMVFVQAHGAIGTDLTGLASLSQPDRALSRQRDKAMARMPTSTPTSKGRRKCHTKNPCRWASPTKTPCRWARPTKNPCPWANPAKTPCDATRPASARSEIGDLLMSLRAAKAGGTLGAHAVLIRLDAAYAHGGMTPLRANHRDVVVVAAGMAGALDRRGAGPRRSRSASRTPA